MIDKIYLDTKDKLFTDIIDKYKKQWFCIINFIYFASYSKYILEEKDNLYKKALENCDFLLPDGIALKLFLEKKYKKKVKENLNWTDFTPYFLDKLKWKNIHLATYSVYDEKIWKRKEDIIKLDTFIKKKYNPKTYISFISHYKNRWDLDLDKYRQSLANWKYDYKIFLVWLWSPFQEKYIEENRNFFKENDIIVFNVWWLFDFWVWFEKRAPKFIRKLKLEWLWRLWQNPKKNFWKVKESFKLFKILLSKK